MTSRELVYKFLQLPWHTRYELIEESKIFDEGSLHQLHSSDEQLLYIMFFERLVKKKDKLKELEIKLSNM